MAGGFETVLIDIIGRDRASVAFDKAGAAAERSARRMSGATAVMSRAGATMTKTLTVPVVAAAAVSTKIAMDYQKSMTLLQTAGGETQRKMTVISSGITKVAEKTGTSLGQLSEGMYTVAKAGSQKWSAVDQLKVLQAGAEGAKAEGVDLGVAMNALTSVMMSYHLGAGKAVATENMLIAGAGKAKTTMQEYAGALSTVIPIASANGVKFQEVAGAIATLTQHGTSADEATQELANTIRNLAAPSQVAQKAMQQLGLKVNDVSQNLGKGGKNGGLAGTLGMIETALSKNSHAGMVVVDSFKRAQAATNDLHVMISKMPADLAKASQAFLDGKVNYTDYRKQIKAMGADGYAMGSQFLALTGKAKGFSDVLRNGSPAQQTAAAQLKAMLGGATGLNTALQLGGENAGYFHKAIDDVAKAAKGAGADVLGWSKTSGTLAFKMDQAKAKLEVMGLEIGNQLIPVVSKLVGYVQHAAEWFGNLSPAMQHNVVTAALVVAALGPVITIVTRVSTAVRVLYGTGAKLIGWGASAVTAGGRFVAGMRMAEISVVGMSTRSYTAGMKMRSVFSAIGTGAMGAGRFVVNSFKNAGAALAGIGPAMRNAESFGGKLSAIGAGAAGAAGAMGPLMGIMAGAAGLIGVGMYAWNDYQQQQAQVAAETESLTSAIEADSGALGMNTKAAIVNILQKRGMLMAAQSVGISVKGMTAAYMGNAAAMKVVTEQVGILEARSGPMGKGDFTTDQRRSIALLGGQFNIVSGEVGVAKTQAAAWKAAMGQSATATGSAANEVDRLSTSLQNLDGGTLSAAQASISFQQSLGNVKQLVQQNGPAFQGTAAKALELRSALVSSLQAAEAHASALHDTGVGAAGVKAALAGDIDALSRLAGNLHMSKSAFHDLLAQFHLTPKDVKTKISADASGAKAAASDAQNKITSVKQLTIPKITADATDGTLQVSTLQAFIDRVRQGQVPSIDVNTDAGAQKLQYLEGLLYGLHNQTVTITTKFVQVGNGPARASRASGGAMYGPGTRTSDSIPANLSNGEHVLTADEVDKVGGQGAVYRMRSMIRQGVMKFASGGAVIRHVGKHWIYKGTQYSSLTAAQNAEHSDEKAQRQGAQTHVQGVIGSIGNARTNQIDVSSTGIVNVMRQIKAARAALAADVRKGLIDGKTEAKDRAQINKLAREAQRQLGRIKWRIGHVDSTALQKAVKRTVADAQAAFATMLADARAADVSAGRLQKAEATERRILSDIRQRTALENKLGTKAAAPTAYDKLASAKANYSNESSATRSAITGAFDITTAGAHAQVYNDQAAAPTTGRSILASIKALVAKAKTFRTVLGKLAKAGLAPTLLSKLAQAGPDALDQAQALLNGGGSVIREITSQYKQLDSIAASTGKLTADKLYGGKVNDAQKAVTKLTNKIDHLNGSIEKLAKGVAGELEPKKHKPGKGHGHDNGHGHKSGGHGGGNGHHGRAVTINGGVHIHEAKDPHAAARELTRHLAHLGSA